MPAKTCIQNYFKTLESRFRGSDLQVSCKSSYKAINSEE